MRQKLSNPEIVKHTVALPVSPDEDKFVRAQRPSLVIKLLYRRLELCPIIWRRVDQAEPRRGLAANSVGSSALWNPVLRGTHWTQGKLI